MLTDNGILARRIGYGCCVLSYMHAYEVAETYGDTACAEKNYRLALYMMWAQSVANRTAVEGEDGCFDRDLAEQIFKSADCFCSPCGCGEPPDSIPFPPPPDPCAAVPTGAALAAVDVADRVAIQAAGPAVGDTYYVVSFTGGSGWSLNTLQTWNGTGWDAEAVAIGSIIEVGGGELWTYLGLGLPGLLYPTVTMTWVGGTPEQYVLQSDYPQVALFTGRTAMVQLLTPGGWQTVFQGPEADLAVPIPFDATGFSFTAVTVTYTLGSCAWTASTGSIEPDGCVFPGAHSCSSHDIDSHF